MVTYFTFSQEPGCFEPSVIAEHNSVIKQARPGLAAVSFTQVDEKNRPIASATSCVISNTFCVNDIWNLSGRVHGKSSSALKQFY